MCYSYPMIRTNFYFPEETIARLRAVREATGIPVSRLIRNAIDSYLDTQVPELVKITAPARRTKAGLKPDPKRQNHVSPSR